MDEIQSKMLSSVLVCTGLLAVVGVGFLVMSKQMDKLDKGEIQYEE